MKILMLLSRVPDTLEKGDKLRAYWQLKYLSQFHDVHLFCISDKEKSEHNLDALAPYCKSIEVFTMKKRHVFFQLIKHFFSKKPIQFGFFNHPKAHRKLKQFFAELQPDHLYCQLIRMAPYAEHFDIPKTLDYQDAFSEGMFRRMKKSMFLRRLLFYTEYRRLRKAEEYYFDRFQGKTIISKADQELIPHSQRENILIVKNGVDFSRFCPHATKEDVDILFTGNLAYPPNVLAAQFLAKEIVPLLLFDFPDLKVQIVGANPKQAVLRLQSENVKISASVPDISFYYARTRLFVAPMMLGTGLQNKLLEAMSMKKACITTALANNSLGASPGSEVILAETPAEFAKYMVSLLSDRKKREQLAATGYHFVHQNYAWSVENEKLNHLIIQNTKK